MKTRTLKPLWALGALLVAGLPSTAIAQAAQESGGALIQGFSNEAVLIFSLGATLTILLGIFAVLAMSIYGLMAPSKEEVVAKTEEPTPFWAWFWEKFNAAKPRSEEEDILLDHAHDGIRELDNKLPPWWIYGFYLSIVFAVVYLWVFHWSDDSEQAVSVQEYYTELRVAEAKKESYLARMESMIDESNVELLTDGNQVSQGEELFLNHCRACHGAAGEGGIGPNLTDPYWIHGGSISDVFSTVKYGVSGKGMLPWQDKMTPKQMQQVSSFIMTLQGTDPPNAKEPQGTKYTPDEDDSKSEDGAEGDALSDL